MVTVNRSVTGKARGAISAPRKKLLIEKIASSLGLPASDNSAWWTFSVHENYAYSARGTKGIYAIDLSNPSNPSESDSSFTHDTAGSNSGHTCRGTAIIGKTLVTCTRSGVTGRIETWDISTPGTLGSNVGVTTDVYENTLDHLYSAMDTDGEFVYVSGQTSGLWKFDVSDITDIQLVGSLTTGNWETQGIAVYGGYVYCANYIYGLRVVDAATLGLVTDVVVPRPTIDGVLPRPWECTVGTVRGTDYLFVSTNRENNSESRGLLVYDISDPSTITPATVHVGEEMLPAADVAPWNLAADPLLQGLSFLDGYIYCANGTKGVAPFDVNEPSNPIFLGNYQLSDAVDSIIGITAFKHNGNPYIITGDGNQPIDTGTNKIYIGAINR